MIVTGNCLEVMADVFDDTFDAIVTDPPYGLEFMGKEWDRLGATAEAFGESLNANGDIDYHGKGNAPFGGGGQRVRYGQSARSMQAWHEAWAREALRVLKPGGHLVAFGGTRTCHRLACAIEDAGFEIRDTIMWLYGSGFPKSLNVSKAIDKAAGAERADLGPSPRAAQQTAKLGTSALGDFAGAPRLTAPATPDAERWDGWGTALKPAHEPIVVARKPFKGAVAANVLAHGTGALNVDGCRIGFTSEADERESKDKNRHADFGSGPRENRVFGADERDRGEHGNYDPPGRWPANVILDQEAGELLDEQSGQSTSRVGEPRTGRNGEGWGMSATGAEYADTGGASRFFYRAKTSRAERNAGLETRNNHPTVKPIALMRWLVRLVTPPDGLVLDPFAGSGTTGIACHLEGTRFVGIEREPEYVAIAEARLEWWQRQPAGIEVAAGLIAEAERERMRAMGQLEIAT